MKLTTYESLREQVYYDKLDSGMPVFVFRKPDFIKKYAVIFVNVGGSVRGYKIGSQEFSAPAGAAHYLEHLMFNAESGDNKLDVFSQNGAEPNGSTDISFTNYHFSCVDRFHENLAHLCDIVSSPHITDEAVEKERPIITQEMLTSRDSPAFLGRQGLLGLLNVGSEHLDPIIGTPESLPEITAETLRDLHRGFYAPANMALAVAGDVDPDEVFETARRCITHVYTQPATRIEPTVFPANPTEQRGKATSGTPIPIFMLGSATPAYPSGEERVREETLSGIALGYLVKSGEEQMMARLYAEGKVLGIAPTTERTATQRVTTILGLAPDPEVVFAEISAEIAKIAANGVDERTISRIKKAVRGQTLMGFDSFSTLCNIVASWKLVGYDGLKAQLLYEDVTADEISEYLSRAFAPEKLAMFTVEPAMQLPFPFTMPQ
ncbi:MAG: insulinase family protein [Oscillospiraceae bacterium]|jgi:predicted Zn-dependent peptidase|nr:insulinase family protein [Oscillospiraceae bacterium]